MLSRVAAVLRSARRSALVVGAATAAALIAPAARAQSPDWTATLFVQPNPSAFLADWQRNPQTAMLTLLYRGTAPQDIHVQGFVRSAARGELARVVSPTIHVDFGPVTQFFTAADILDWETVSRDPTYVDQVVRTGTIPEGRMQLCAQVLSAANVTLAQACADFTISLPEPPQLLFPLDAAVVAGLLPVFQWTPVFLPPEVGATYHLRVVEQLEGQTSQTAMQANRTWFETTTSGVPIAVYTPDALALDPAKHYVWTVEVLDGEGHPLTRAGRPAEARSFAVGGAGQGGEGAVATLPDTLTLVPGVARLTGLASADVRTTDFSFVVNGWVNLEVSQPFAAVVRVQAEDLELDRNSIRTVPTARSGDLRGTLRSGLVPADVLGPWLTLSEISFAPGTGLSVSGALHLAGAPAAPMTGTLQVLASGLYGVLTAEGADGAPLATLGSDPAVLVVRRARLSLPGGAPELTADLRLFGRDVGCTGVRAAVSAEGALTARVACAPGTPVPLGGDSSRTQLTLRSVSGDLSAGLADGAFHYTLSASGSLQVDAGVAGGAGAGCGAALTLALQDGQLTVPSFTPHCDAAEGEADLGWLHARLSSLALERLAWTQGQGLDFALRLSLALSAPGLDGVQLPTLDTVRITSAGLAIPATEVALSGAGLRLAGFGIKVTKVRLPAFTLSWSDWSLGSAAGFHFGLDAELSLPDLPAAAAACLASGPIALSGAEISNGKLRLTLAEHRFTPACGITLQPPPASDGADVAQSGGTGSGASGAAADNAATGAGTTGAVGAPSNPDEWSDPFKAVREPAQPLSEPPLVDAGTALPTDSPEIQRLYTGDAARLGQDEAARRQRLSDPSCGAACLDSLRQAEEQTRTATFATWTQRDFGAINRQTAACLTQSRQATPSGSTEPDCASIFDRKVQVLDAIAQRITRPLTATACRTEVQYFTSAALQVGRERSLLGGEPPAEASAAEALMAECRPLQLQQLQKVCSAAQAPSPSLRDYTVAIAVSDERRRQLLNGDDNASSSAMNAVSSCLAPRAAPVAAAGGDGEGVPFGPGDDEPVAATPARRLRGLALAAAPDDAGTGVRLELTRIGGQLVIGFAPFFQVESLPEVDGDLVLPALFQCPDSAARRQPLLTTLRLGPHGEVDGTVSGLAPSCPVDLGAVHLTVSEASLTFSTASGRQSAVLRAAASASFDLAATPVTGRGRVAVDLLHGRLIDGSLTLQGPLRLDLPREKPLLSFTLAAATLDSAGLHVDGRGRLALADTQGVDVTLDKVLIDLTRFRLRGGRVVFDASFGLDAGLAPDGSLTWRAVPRGSAAGVTNGVHVDLPSQAVLDTTGFSVSGDGSARLLLDGRDVDSVTATFSTDFALGIAPPAVARGNLELKRGSVSLATIDALGFHPNLAVLASALVPARLGLPSESVAYLALRADDGTLRVQVANAGSGVRIYTAPNAGIPLVIPALQLGRATAPQLTVGFDVTLDPLGRGVSAGAITVAVAPADRAALDLSALGIPLAIDTLAYDRESGGAYRLAVGGALMLFGQAQTGATGSKVLLTVDGTGTLTGSVDVTPNASIALVPGSDKVMLGVQRVRGTFNAGLTSGRLAYTLSLDGSLDVATAPSEGVHADATLEVSERGVKATRVAVTGGDATRFIDLGGFRLGLRNLRVPSLAWAADAGFRFELLFDAVLDFPALGNLTLPPIADISLRQDGFTIPAYEIPQLTLQQAASAAAGAAGFDSASVAGLPITPLAFRMGAVRYNWFTGQGPADWGFGFDLELSLARLLPEAPASLRAMKVRVLNAGLRGGHPVGTIERVSFPQPPDLGFGDLTALWGQLPGPPAAPANGAVATPDTAPVLSFEVNLHLAQHLPFCDAQITSTHDTLSVYADGWVAGHVQDLVANCTAQLGPVTFTLGSTTLDVAGQVLPLGTSSVPRTRRLELGMSATLEVPGVDGTPVRAQGAVRVDALAGRIISGRIDVPKPFRWAPADGNPYLAFDVDRGYLDASGLHFTGGGHLRLADGASVGVTFNDLALGLPDLRVSAGSVTFTSQFALGVSVGTSGLTFGAYAVNAARPSGSSFRAVLPASVTLDKDGLRADGTASASLAFGGQEFAAVQVGFSGGFAIGFQPVKVRAGRADFVLNGDTVAHVDADGFWPGNVLAVLPIPARLGLPTEDVAYLQLRDASTNALLVETSTSSSGVALRTRSGATVRLVVPALGETGQAAPAADVAFDVVVNPSTFQLVSGSIRAQGVDTAALFSLRGLGVPLDVRALAYAQVGGAYALRVSARVALPASLASADLVLNDLTLTRTGLSGTADLGTYKETYDATLLPVRTVPLGQDLSLDVTGLHAAFGTSPSVKLSGVLKAPFFAAQGGAPAPLFFTADVTPSGVALSVDPAKLPAPELPVLAATFLPQSLGGQPAIRVTASASAFTVRLSGVLQVPSLSSGLAVTVDGLEIGTAGVHMPAIALSGQAQQFTLFGATFALRDSSAGGQVVFPALAGSYAQGVMTLSLSGDVTFLDNTTRFTGLTVTSAGAVTLASASLISKPLTLVAGALTLDTLAIHGNRLRAALTVTLPAPLDGGGPQHAAFEVGADGTISGGAVVTLADEPAGLNPQSRFQFDVGVATVHLRHLALSLDAANLKKNSAVTVVGDVYLGNDEGNLIQLGDVVGGTVKPGLRIGFDGTVTWGNLALARSFDFDFDAVRLHIASVALPPQANGFAVAFGGQLSLRAPDVSGSLDFRDFTITSRGTVEFSPSGVTGGSFSMGGSLAVLTASGFSFSATPTTLDVRSGGMPGTGQSASPRVDRVTVDSYVRFGGSVSVADVFSGQVGEFLAYRTADGRNHLIVHDAQLDIQNVLTSHADLRYDEDPAGFALVLGAQGQLLGKAGIALVGAISRDQQATHAGIFIAAQGLNIPMPGLPVITITDLGGGFFLNPKPEYLDLVRQLAQVSQTAGQQIAAPPGNVAVLLYGQAEIVDRNVIRGRVLLTLMNTAIQIDGAVDVLDQGNNFSGDAHLVVGLRRAYAEGNIGLRVHYPGMVEGNAQLNLFVYDASHWGVLGNTDLTIVSFLKGSSTIFLGPPGMVIQAKINAGFDVLVVKVDQSFDCTLWYRKAAQEWGGYVAVGVNASVLGGLLSATGTLKGAVVLAQSPYVYAAAELKVSAAGQAWDGVVWLKLEGGKPSAGFGSDPAMDAAIAAAVSGAADMMGARDQAQSAMQAVQSVGAPQTALSEQELVQAYNRVQGWSPLGLVFTLAEVDGAERSAPIQSGEATYRGWYADVLGHVGLPGDTAAVVSLARDVTGGFQALEARRAAVRARIGALRVSLQAVTPTPLPAIPDNPVRDTSFAPPAFTERVTAAGDTERVVTSWPRFDVDATAAASAVAAVGVARAQADALDGQVRDEIAALEAGLVALRAATTTADTTGLPSFAGRYAAVASTAERQFAAQADLLLKRQDWSRGRLRQLFARDTTATRWIHGKDSTYAVVTRGAPWADSAVAWTRVATLAGDRLAFLIAFSGSATLRPQFALDTAAASHRRNAAGQADWAARLNAIEQLADTLGRQLWFHVARAGMTAADAAVDTALPALATTAATRLGAIRDAHGQLSQSLGALYAAQATATGALYDLYDRYLFWRTGATGTPKVSTSVAAAAPTAQDLADTTVLRRRKAALFADLSVPRVTGIQVAAVSADPYTAQLQFTWSAWHPSGVYEYQYRDVSGANQALAGALLSNGSTGSLAAARFTADPTKATAVTHTLQVGARGGAGFTGYGRATYTVSFQARAASIKVQGEDVPTVTGGGLAADSTPPARPVITFPGRTIRTGGTGQSSVWTGDASQLDVAWSADDPESGIAGYEYALWSTPQGTEVRPFTAAGGRTGITLDRLGLTAGKPLYVAVRARNPQGLVSPVGVSAAIRYDATPPAFATGAAIQTAPGLAVRAAGVAPATLGGAATIPTVAPCASPVPAGASAPTAAVTGAVPPVAAFTLPAASDAESGVQRYWYRLAAAPDTVFDAATWTRVSAMPSLSFEGAPLAYGTTYYLTLASVNYAGLASRPITYGPLRVGDPTPPTDPAFCAALAGSNDRFAVQFTAWSADPESGVQGYRYRVRSAAGTVARAFPTSGVDWVPDNAQGTLGAARTTAAVTLVSGQSYYVDVRPVNGEGSLGTVTASGPFLVDATPPPAPSASARYVATSTARSLTVTLVAPDDPETGVTTVQCAIGSSAGASDVGAWTAVATAAGTSTRTIDLQFRPPSGTKFWIQVRSRNGAGQWSATGQASVTFP